MISAILLAAGRSTRMGTQKVLLPFGNATVIEHIVNELEKSLLVRILVVVGPEGDRVRQLLRGRAVTIVENPDPGGDMLSSVRCGLRALPDASTGILVALGDQPRVTTELIDAMLRTFQNGAAATGTKGIVVPIFEGKRGHPLLFAARYRSELLAMHDGVGLRGLLAAHADDVLEIPWPDPSVLSDMDDPEAYRRERGLCCPEN